MLAEGKKDHGKYQRTQPHRRSAKTRSFSLEFKQKNYYLSLFASITPLSL